MSHDMDMGVWGLVRHMEPAAWKNPRNGVSEWRWRVEVQSTVR